MADPASRLALVRSWKTSTLLVKNGAFSSEDIAAIKAFCSARSFDVAFYPGMKPQEANRYNVVAAARPVRRRNGAAGSGQRRIPAELQVRHRPGHRRQAALLPLLQVALAARAAVAEGARRPAAAGMGLSGARRHAGPGGAREPAADRGACGLGHVGRRPAARQRAARPDRAAASSSTLLAIGFAFMFIEIAFIQKFVLFLSHPLYAVAVVLFAFLLFAGIGSAASRRLARRQRAGAAARGGRGGRRDCAVGGALPRPASLAVPARGGAAGRR